MIKLVNFGLLNKWKLKWKTKMEVILLNEIQPSNVQSNVKLNWTISRFQNSMKLLKCFLSSFEYIKWILKHVQNLLASTQKNCITYSTDTKLIWFQSQWTKDSRGFQTRLILSKSSKNSIQYSVTKFGQKLKFIVYKCKI